MAVCHVGMMQLGALSPPLFITFSIFSACKAVQLCEGSWHWTVLTCHVGQQNPICLQHTCLPPTCTCDLHKQKWLAEPLGALCNLCSLAGCVLSQLAEQAGKIFIVMKYSPQGHVWSEHLLQFSFYRGCLKGAALPLQSEKSPFARIGLHYLNRRWCLEGCCVAQQQMGVFALLD